MNSHSKTPSQTRISLFGLNSGDHTPREFDDVKPNATSGLPDRVTAATAVSTPAGFISRTSYFAGAAASLSIVWKLCSSSQNCSARVHFGFNTNGRRAVQGLV